MFSVVLAGGGLAAALVVSDDGGSSHAAPTVSIGAIQLAADNTAAAESMEFELHSSGMLGVSASGVVDDPNGEERELWDRMTF